MRKLSRFVVVPLTAALALVIVVLIGANLYVQSEGTQARIQQELSQRLGATLHIQRISVTPWGGLKLSGITIPQNVAGRGGNFLAAKTFRLHLRLFSLFSKQLVIREISLVDANVVWAQNESGKWQLPGAKNELAPGSTTMTNEQEEKSSQATQPSASPEIPFTPPPQADTPRPARESEKAPFQPEVRHINVMNGDFRFLDRTGNTLATFTALNFRSTLGAARILRGKATVKKVSLRDRFFLSALQTPVHYDSSKLDLPKITATAANGELSGNFTLLPEAQDSPFTLSVKFRNLQADQLVTEAGGPSGMVRGNLEGNFFAEGKTANVDAMTGAGEIFLRDGQLQQYSLLVALGQILQIEELTQLHLDQAQAKYHVTPGLVTVDELLLRSPNIRLSATGTVGFNGRLRLESQLAINDKVRSQLFKPVRQNFQPINEPGYSVVDFQIMGTIEHPKSNLVDKVVGKDLKDIGSVINSFLGGSKSDRSKKKKAREAEPTEPSPTPTPTPTPAP